VECQFEVVERQLGAGTVFRLNLITEIHLYSIDVLAIDFNFNAFKKTAYIITHPGYNRYIAISQRKSPVF